MNGPNQSDIKDCPWCGSELQYREVPRLIRVCPNASEHMKTASGMLQQLVVGTDAKP